MAHAMGALMATTGEQRTWTRTRPRLIVLSSVHLSPSPWSSSEFCTTSGVRLCITRLLYESKLEPRRSQLMHDSCSIAKELS